MKKSKYLQEKNKRPTDRQVKPQAREGEKAKARAEQEAIDAHRLLRRSHAAAPSVHIRAERCTEHSFCLLAQRIEELLLFSREQY